MAHYAETFAGLITISAGRRKYTVYACTSLTVRPQKFFAILFDACSGSSAGVPMLDSPNTSDACRPPGHLRQTTIIFAQLGKF